jgi:hypothetical protein
MWDHVIVYYFLWLYNICLWYVHNLNEENKTTNHKHGAQCAAWQCRHCNVTTGQDSINASTTYSLIAAASAEGTLGK